MRLEGKVAIVTGGGRGIGRATAHALAGAGARVLVCDRGTSVDSSTVEDAGVAAGVAGEIAATGAAALASEGDVTDMAAVEGIFGTALAAWGRVDVVVNAAGIIRDRMLWNVPPEEWDDIVRVHLRSCYALTRSFAEHVRARGDGDDAALVTFSSSAGVFGNVGSGAYGTAKAGVLGFTRIAAMELMRYGVRVNCIVPFAWTRMAEVLPGETEAERKRLDALRSLSPDRVANLVAWVAASGDPQLTGQVLGLRGRELLVFAQPSIESIVLVEDAGEAGFAEAFRDLALPPLRASSEIFAHEPIVE